MGNLGIPWPPTPKLGIIAGNGHFPFLVLDAARAQGYEVVVDAIKEETTPEIELKKGCASSRIVRMRMRSALAAEGMASSPQG